MRKTLYNQTIKPEDDTSSFKNANKILNACIVVILFAEIVFIIISKL